LGGIPILKKGMHDSINKYLALDRHCRDYILGRGVNEDRLLMIKGMGATKSGNSDVDINGPAQICRAELIVSTSTSAYYL
jgi:hypothetical protein